MPADIIFPPAWTRSDRRRYSRDQARKYTRYNTPGQPQGRPATYPRPRPPRPASTRSGQARINHKRNQRAAFLEHLIALPVSEQLAEFFDVDAYLRRLPSRIIRREKHPYMFQWIYHMHVPGAPDAAATMNLLTRINADRTISVTGIEWWRADGTYLGAEDIT